jgi:hypothetical protein
MIPITLIARYVAEIFDQFWPYAALIIGLILAVEIAFQVKNLLRGGS